MTLSRPAAVESLLQRLRPSSIPLNFVFVAFPFILHRIPLQELPVSTLLQRKGRLEGNPVCGLVSKPCMEDGTVSHRHDNTLPAPELNVLQVRQIFSRMITTAGLALVLAAAVIGCHSASGQTASSGSGDPSDVNGATAQTCPPGQVLMSDNSCAAPDQSQPAPQPSPQSYPSQQATAAPPSQPEEVYAQEPQQPYGQSGDYNSGDYETQNPYDDQTYQQDAYNDGYQQGYERGLEASQPPPPLPVYEQPLCPGPGYMWNPGYWSYGNGGYYWVPGVWVLAPYTGALWTPGWWGFFEGLFRWHSGYWGPHIGFYGGIPYGYGYTGDGFQGGYWDHDRFMYNRSVTNINTTNITNVYNRTVIVNQTSNRVSYNGGRGGLTVRPTQAQFNAMREQHVRPLPTQVAHRTQAMQNRQQFASVNHGKPAMVVAAKPLAPHHINPAPAVVNPGVHGATRPTPVASHTTPARPGAPAPPARPNGPARPNNTGARPAEPARPNQPAPSQPVREPNRPQPSHTEPAQPHPAPEPAPAHPQPEHTAPQPAHPAEQPRPETRPAPEPAHPAPQPRPESRPAPEPAHPAPQPRPESRPAPEPARPAPQPRPESRSAPEPARPAPQPRPETRPEPARPEPQARPESRPEPQPRPEMRSEPPREAPHDNQRPDNPHR
jgi:YXWGXW repeat-containing protein